MNSHASEQDRNPDLIAAEIAMQRAAQLARQEAARYGVELVYEQDGMIIRERVPFPAEDFPAEERGRT